jgi:hypothetical protein
MGYYKITEELGNAFLEMYIREDLRRNDYEKGYICFIISGIVAVHDAGRFCRG